VTNVESRLMRRPQKMPTITASHNEDALKWNLRNAYYDRYATALGNVSGDKTRQCRRLPRHDGSSLSNCRVHRRGEPKRQNPVRAKLLVSASQRGSLEDPQEKVLLSGYPDSSRHGSHSITTLHFLFYCFFRTRSRRE